MKLSELPTFAGGDTVRCVVESPAGSPTKLRYDPEHDVFELARALVKGLTYPFDWGFIPSTEGPDGDPLDVMIIHDTPTTPGVVIQAKVIGVLEVEQSSGRKAPERNDRFLAVPVDSRRQDGVRDVKDLPKRLRDELQRFFEDAAQLEDKKLRFLGWRGARHALRGVRAGAKAG